MGRVTPLQKDGKRTGANGEFSRKFPAPIGLDGPAFGRFLAGGLRRSRVAWAERWSRRNRGNAGCPCFHRRGFKSKAILTMASSSGGVKDVLDVADLTGQDRKKVGEACLENPCVGGSIPPQATRNGEKSPSIAMGFFHGASAQRFVTRRQPRARSVRREFGAMCLCRPRKAAGGTFGTGGRQTRLTAR